MHSKPSQLESFTEKLFHRISAGRVGASIPPIRSINEWASTPEYSLEALSQPFVNKL
jgi:hypothetical protein